MIWLVVYLPPEKYESQIGSSSQLLGKIKMFYIIRIYMIWLVVDLPLWKMMEFVSWDDEIPNIWKNKLKDRITPHVNFFQQAAKER